jgi:hypothetical protein
LLSFFFAFNLFLPSIHFSSIFFTFFFLVEVAAVQVRNLLEAAQAETGVIFSRAQEKEVATAVKPSAVRKMFTAPKTMREFFKGGADKTLQDKTVQDKTLQNRTVQDKTVVDRVRE